MSTVAFLMLGAPESNPLIRLTLALGSTPLAGLLVAKGIAISLGIYVWSQGRERVLLCANLIFAAVVAWNLAIVILQAAVNA